MSRSKKFREKHPEGLQSVHTDKLRARAANYRVEKQAPLLDEEVRPVTGVWDPFDDRPASYDYGGCECVFDGDEYSCRHYQKTAGCSWWTRSGERADHDFYRFRCWLTSIWAPALLLASTLPDAASSRPSLVKQESGTDVLSRFSWYEKISHYWVCGDQWSSEISERLPAYFPDGKISGRIQAFVQEQLDQGVQIQSLKWLDLVVLFRPFWIRDPDEWTGDSKEGLLAYLFADRQYPAFLNDQWIDLSTAMDEGFVWQHWLIMLGQGINLSRHYSRLHRQFEKHLFSIPWDRFVPRFRTATVAALTAEAKRLGASDDTILRLMRNAAFVSSPLDVSAPFLAFWRDTVRWLERHIHHYDTAQSDEVLAWAVHLHTEGLQAAIRDLRLRGLDPPYSHEFDDDTFWEPHLQHPVLFRWKGRTAESALAAARQYHGQLQAIELANIAASFGLRGQLSWNKKGWDAQFNTDQERWDIVELCSLAELIEEGKALSHCVATYAGKCIAGRSAIFSMKINGVRRLTIEVNCATGQILQSRGEANRASTPQEHDILKRWYRELLARLHQG